MNRGPASSYATGIAVMLLGAPWLLVQQHVEPSFDLAAANAVPDFRHHNGGNGDALRFEDTGLISGTGYSEDGKALAGMGTELADLDGNGTPELLVTNFALEPINLYREIAPGTYLDDSYPLGLGEASLPVLGFGIAAVDLDGDEDRDVVVANGHILDNVEELKDNITYAQPNQLFVNQLTDLRRTALESGAQIVEATLTVGERAWSPMNGLFADATDRAGPGFELVEVSRGLAYGDAEGDGRPDLVITNSNGPARLLINRSPAVSRHLVLRLRGRSSNRDAFGARIVVVPTGGDPRADGSSGFTQTFEVRSASSYCSQNATDLYVGLGESPTATVEIQWPHGLFERFKALDAGRLVVIVEGRGIAASRPLQPNL